MEKQKKQGRGEIDSVGTHTSAFAVRVVSRNRGPRFLAGAGLSLLPGMGVVAGIGFSRS